MSVLGRVRCVFPPAHQLHPIASIWLQHVIGSLHLLRPRRVVHNRNKQSQTVDTEDTTEPVAFVSACFDSTCCEAYTTCWSHTSQVKRLLVLPPSLC